MRNFEGKLNAILVLLIIPIIIFSKTGEVYLVIGSDTAIWDDMDLHKFNCIYNPELYTNPMDNTYSVMNVDFREGMRDSYNTPMKLTWWMMAGNIFRYAENTNVPIPNIMTLYLMNKYHSETISQVGDEITLHYHTFKWSDYDNDGNWWWNQAKEFNECLNDFEFTMNQCLLEENMFPVSFRSGWHFMSNEWQSYLNNILPYSMHNAYPHKHKSNNEPIANDYDWSQAPSDFIPYHPSVNNYQIPGNGKGWNLRSAHMNEVRSRSLMDSIFYSASLGKDQIACLWAHLPESTFINNVVSMNNLAHDMAIKYPDVKFRYCTAVEAMQRWQNTSDTTSPIIGLYERSVGTTGEFIIISNEDIFQNEPYFAIKTIYEEYKKISLESKGKNIWITNEPININEVVKAGVAVCDNMGNQTTKIKKYLPDDIYIDNDDDDFSTEAGSWINYNSESWQTWGITSLITNIDENDSASAIWRPDIKADGLYNVFFRVPPFSNIVDEFSFIIQGDQKTVTAFGNSSIVFNEWNHISTINFSKSQNNYIQIKAKGGGNLVVDALRISPLVKDYDIEIKNQRFNINDIIVRDTMNLILDIKNNGVKDLLISQIKSENNCIFHSLQYPIKISAMSKDLITLKYSSSTIGKFIDTLQIFSNDIQKPNIKIPIYVNVQNYFKIIDNEDSLHYHEYGIWHTSVAEAYGSSSRYSWLDSGQPYAIFDTKLSRSGYYDIMEIVPYTLNSSNHANYIISINGVAVDTFIVDQNQGSGDWKIICRKFINADETVEVMVLDDDKNTNTRGPVLRGDAIKFSLVETVTEEIKYKQIPKQYKLSQNYPNPFNSKTIINYFVPKYSKVQLIIYNTRGEKVTELLSEFKKPGQYELTWNANSTSSGIYFYQLKANNFSITKKMIIIK